MVEMDIAMPKGRGFTPRLINEYPETLKTPHFQGLLRAQKCVITEGACVVWWLYKKDV